MTKLAIITTHPIQYYAPLFKLMAQSDIVALKVFYTWGNIAKNKIDPGFGKPIEWDIPLLDGYEYTFVKNIAQQPGSHHFWGIQNPTLLREVKEYNPDAILIIGWAYRSHLRAIIHFAGLVPLYFRGDSHLIDNQHTIRHSVRKWFLRWVYSHFYKIFYVGHYNREYFLHFNIKQHRLVWAPHAIDNERFADNNNTYYTQAEAIRTKLGIKNTHKVILFAGKLEPKKNPILLLKAFLKVNRHDVHLIFVGNGVLENKLKEMAHLTDNIHFMDFQNQTQMPVIYRMCDIFCLPSKGPNETWGLAVNEAMACGKALLVSDKCGCSYDLVMNDGNGYIFKSDDIQSLTKKLQWMLGNSDLKMMGDKSLQIIKNWNYEKLSNIIINTIVSLK
ncbi:MAG: glycosyltransferase family 4 protein [Cytophagales bacterium]|nr:glycosyltransferase family 4 protein [Cytophagales bacterium]